MERAELYFKCKDAFNGKKSSEWGGCIPLYSEMQYGFRDQYGGDSPDGSDAFIWFCINKKYKRKI